MSELIDYIMSPKTGRKIKVGGDAYEKLMKSKAYRQKALNARRFKDVPPGRKRRGRYRAGHGAPVTPVKTVRKLPKGKPEPLRQTYARTPKSRKAKRRTLEREMKKATEGRGGRTRGWGAAAPQKGRERHALMKECGKGCFLQPSTEGFPICTALDRGEDCAVDCRGLLSAKIRAKQWKYPDIAKRANELGKMYDCAWAE